jgi:C_GCAxxG_C_C family probable redox protein
MLAVGEHMLGQVDDQTLRMATGFSGGIGLSYREICGALSAGIMIIGALHGRTQAGEDDTRCQKLSARFRDRFAQEIGSVYCHELRAERYGSKNQEPCSALVRRAARIFLETLEGDQEKKSMRIAISAENNQGLASQVSHHFGRCPYFILVDVEGQEIKGVTSVENPYAQNHSPGQVPAFIHGQEAQVMLSGGMGRRAVGFFQQYDIQPVTGAAGTVEQTITRYLNGELSGAEPCAESQAHHHHEH